jgi:hypothetical protein
LRTTAATTARPRRAMLLCSSDRCGIQPLLANGAQHRHPGQPHRMLLGRRRNRTDCCPRAFRLGCSRCMRPGKAAQAQPSGYPSPFWLAAWATPPLHLLHLFRNLRAKNVYVLCCSLCSSAPQCPCLTPPLFALGQSE